MQRVAEPAQPGNRIAVRAGRSREPIRPPHSGLSDVRPIVYPAAPGEQLVIKDPKWWGLQKGAGQGLAGQPAEPVLRPGHSLQERTSRRLVRRPGRVHPTRAVYLDGHWLTEARSLEELFLPDGARPAWLIPPPTDEYLPNVA